MKKPLRCFGESGFLFWVFDGEFITLGNFWLSNFCLGSTAR